MKPIVFTIPGINWNIPGYGLMLMIGLFLAIWWAARRAYKSGGNPDVILNCGFIAIIGGVVGCRGMYVWHYWDHFAAQGGFLDILWAVIDVSKGGLEYYGGFILTVVVVLIWLHRFEKVSIRWYLDIIAPSAAMGLAIGRIGCFLNGCCFGGTCDLPWAVRFPFGSSACLHQWKEHVPGGGLREELMYTDKNSGVSIPLLREFFTVSDERLNELAQIRKEVLVLDEQRKTSPDLAEKERLQARLAELERKGGSEYRDLVAVSETMNRYGMKASELRAFAESARALPVHPTQLYSTITALLIAFFLNAMYWRRTRDGQVICTLLLIEPVSRWLLEVIRADNPIDTIGVFTISQFLAAGMTLLGLAGLIVLRYMPPRSPRAKLWEPPAEETASEKKPQAAKTGRLGGQ